MATEPRLDSIEKHAEALPKDGVTCLIDSMEVDFPRGKPLEPGLVKDIRNAMTAAFGGVTTWDGTGCWMDDGKRVCEPVTVLRSRHNCGDAKTVQKVFDVVGGAARAADQVAVGLAGSTRFYIIPKGKFRGGPEK